MCAVAQPACVTVQTALLGKFGGSASIAGFAAVGTSANLICVLFNFLVDGVSAKVTSPGADSIATGLHSIVPD